jgi:hypothetical protein
MKLQVLSIVDLVNRFHVQLVQHREIILRDCPSKHVFDFSVQLGLCFRAVLKLHLVSEEVVFDLIPVLLKRENILSNIKMLLVQHL